MQRYTTWFDKDLPSLSKTKWAESKRVGKMLFVSSQVVKIKSLVHITMSSLSPADGIWCIQLKAVLCRSIDEWVLRYLAPIGLRSASKSNTPIVWGFQQVPSQNVIQLPIKLWMYHFICRFGIFRFAVKNASVNSKWTRTKCIIFLFGSDQTNRENRTTSVNAPLLSYVGNSGPQSPLSCRALVQPQSNTWTSNQGL